jgi:carbohydrate-binding DOMON domain-containing protein
MENIVMLKAAIFQAVDAIINQALSRTNTDTVTATIMALNMLVNMFTDDIRAFIKEREQVNPETYEETLPDSDIVQD